MIPASRSAWSRWLLGAVSAMVLLGSATPSSAQPAGPVMTMRCAGDVGGVVSHATVHVERLHAGTHMQRSFVSGVIQNPHVLYQFQGELFGNNEGFISLVERRSGDRMDRVYIGAVAGGFMIRAENSAPHVFRCQ